MSAPASSTASTSAPSLAKFADKIEGAIQAGCIPMGLVYRPSAHRDTHYRWALNPDLTYGAHLSRDRDATVQRVRRSNASRYFSLVRSMISGGSLGPGGRLSQSSVSR